MSLEKKCRQIHLIAAARPNFMKIAPLYERIVLHIRELLNN